MIIHQGLIFVIESIRLMVKKIRLHESEVYWPGIDQLLEQSQLESLCQDCLPVFRSVLQQEQLADDLLPLLKSVYLPLAAWIASNHNSKPLVIGINGAQGSGKSTLSRLLMPLLTEGFRKSVLAISIDDLYLSRARRQQLAVDVHPLLAVRGVPGTHDVKLGQSIFSRLISSDVRGLKIPVFDKAIDDLLPESQWCSVEQPVDIILFEGWCVAALPQQDAELRQPVNQLEASEDPDGEWRRYVNTQLAGDYQTLFGFIDQLIMLQVPDMESVFQWRQLQEEKLDEARSQAGLQQTHIMSNDEIQRFIMHYERITRSTLNEMPQRADVLLQMNRQHAIDSIKLR